MPRDYFNFTEAAPDSSNTATCCSCGALCTTDPFLGLEYRSAILSGAGDYYCDECLTTKFFICTDCGEVFPIESAITPRRNRKVCPSCYEARWGKCDVCGKVFRRGGGLYNDTLGRSICTDCAENERMFFCEACNRFAPREEAETIFANRSPYCRGCAAEEAKKPFHPYVYKPTPIFYKMDDEEVSSDNGLFYGVELEVDYPKDFDFSSQSGLSRSALSKELQKLNQPIYMKHDGSLSEEGVEIVTHPCSLRYHLETPMWDAVADTCLDEGYASENTSTCGLHIHVSKAGLGETPSDVDVVSGRLLLLIDSIWNDMVKFTRRTASELERWAVRPFIAIPINRELSDRELSNIGLSASTGHYCSINLSPQSTVEFRVFKGSLEAETIRGAVQLVDNMVRYAKGHSSEDCVIASMQDVVDVNATPELVSYCKFVGLLSPT